ncbi:uncharacterized protein LOC125647091 [Ostrea edulis]|uniref:uncharacterized protein LOC125647091 n=1 Tax=Ostrea edulis TaxID=37623 RepID=UPI0024AFBD8F|nr:uncharacterized protein LOC125647091 [Ostrea edulis]
MVCTCLYLYLAGVNNKRDFFAVTAGLLLKLKAGNFKFEERPNNTDLPLFEKVRWDADSLEKAKCALISCVESLQTAAETPDEEQQGTIDSSVDHFTTEIADAMEPFFALKSRLNYQRKIAHSNISSPIDKPWVTTELKRKYNVYRSDLRLFNRNKNSVKHQNLMQSKKEYKALASKLKRRYQRAEGNMLDSMRKHNPKAFYRLFKRKKGQPKNVNPGVFYGHFKELTSRRYGEKRPPFHSLKGFSGGPRKTFGGKGIIGNKKRTGFFDGFRRKGFLGGPRKGFKESIITDKGKSDIIPGKTGIIPDKTGVIDACPPRPCLQTQEFIPQECRRPQFFLHNGRECPDCDIDICIGGSVLPDIRGGWGSGLGPRGTLSPGGPIGPRGNLPGDLDWQSDFGPGFPDASPGINTQIGGGLFPDLPFAGRFGPDRFNRGLGGFDQSGIQNRGQFGPIPGIARTGLVNRLNAGFDFDPSWNTGNVGDFGASWRDNTLPINSRSI